MPVISVRIDDNLKKRMDKFSYVNWSKVLRQELQKVLDSLEKRNMAKAVLINEKVRKKADFDSTDIIRKWRDERYGEGRC
jgi:Arc/MetJ-type ribon-helix-helix transcriptional regulator